MASSSEYGDDEIRAILRRALQQERDGVGLTHEELEEVAAEVGIAPEDLAVELLGLADRYLLNDLKLLCGFTLARMISVETVCRIVQAADRWDARDSQLRAQCIECAMRRASDRGRPTAPTRHRH